jgi:hypothetical protein
LFQNIIDHVFADAADAPGEVPFRLPLLDAALGPFVGRASTSDLGVALKCIIGHKGRLPAGIELRTADRESWSFLSDFQEMIKSAIHGDKRGIVLFELSTGFSSCIYCPLLPIQEPSVCLAVQFPPDHPPRCFALPRLHSQSMCTSSCLRRL